MKPWGVVHDGCCGLRRFKRESVEILAWEGTPDTEDINSRVEALEKFRDFLRGNVVDTSSKRNGKRSRGGRKSRYNKFNNNKNNSINSDSNDTIGNDSNDSIIEIAIDEK